MDDKQIIINGVDVSGCSYYQHNMCTATKDDYGDCSLCCQDYNMNDCYYKQLKRKEQECEELKRVKDDFFKHAEISHEAVLNKNKIIDEQEQQLDQLKQTLAEIKKIAVKQCNICEALTPIDEYKDCKKCWLGIILQKNKRGVK